MARFEKLYADIHSGANVAWPQSIRGKLHTMQSEMAAADKLAEAAREVRRLKDTERKSRLTRWQWVYLALCATAAAAAPYVVLIVH